MKFHFLPKQQKFKKDSGAATLDFIFAFILVSGFSGALLALSLTMTVASVTQYITFASARNYFAGHVSADVQRSEAEKKFNGLVQNPAFRNLYRNDWFEVTPFIPQVNPGAQDSQVLERFPEYLAGNPKTNKFRVGVGADFIARMLNFEIPIFGSTSDDEGDGFTAFLASYLLREPTTQECLSFSASRWRAIRNLAVSQGAPYSTSTQDSGYAPIADNGC